METCSWNTLMEKAREFSENLVSTGFNSKKIILFGAGVYGSMVADYFNKLGRRIERFCDNDIQKQGKLYNGILCISPNALIDYENTMIIITARHKIEELSLQLDQLKVQYISFDKLLISIEHERINMLYHELLSDEISRNTYFTLIKAMFDGDKAEIANYCDEKQYFCLPQFMLSDIDEVFVDCGAYVGNTIERFIWSRGDGLFKKIYAFEPGAMQFKALQTRVKRLINEWALDQNSIQCIPKAVGESNAVSAFLSNDGQLSSSRVIQSINEESSGNVGVVSLDQFFSEKNIYENVSMIKMDVEGSEMVVLKGACNLIKAKTPKLAVCIYHRPTDIIDIPIYLKELVPNYKMAIRHHSNILSETVLYCWK